MDVLLYLNSSRSVGIGVRSYSLPTTTLEKVGRQRSGLVSTISIQKHIFLIQVIIIANASFTIILELASFIIFNKSFPALAQSSAY